MGTKLIDKLFSLVEFVDKHWRLMLGIMALGVIYLFGSFFATLVSREPVEVTVVSGGITQMYFPPNKFRLWPWPNPEFLLKKSEEPAERWKDWVEEILMDQANPERWWIFQRKVEVISVQGDRTSRTTWENFLAMNPEFVVW